MEFGCIFGLFLKAASTVDTYCSMRILYLCLYVYEFQAYFKAESVADTFALPGAALHKAALSFHREAL